MESRGVFTFRIAPPNSVICLVLFLGAACSTTSPLDTDRRSVYIIAMATPQHDRRRAQIIATAQRLFFQEGYEKTTIAQIIEAVGIAKGTFYHYFTSKEELLEALAETMTGPVMASLEEILEDREASALEKIRRYFHGAAVWKANNRELIMALIQTMYRDDNILLRHRLNQFSMQITVGPFTRMVREGVERREFTVTDPEMCAAFILRSFVAASEAMAAVLLRMNEDRGLFRELERHMEFLEEAVRRILGVPEHQKMDLFNRNAVRQMLHLDHMEDNQ